MKRIILNSALLFTGMLSLAGCVSANEVNEEEMSEELEQFSSDNPAPPGLTVQVGEETLSPVMGTYSWSVDNEDGTQTAIEADSAAPPELVSTTEPMNVETDTVVDFDFEEEPDSYEVKIWDEDNTVISEANDIDLSIEGETIYEVLARWEQGTVSYAFSLVIE